MFLAVYLEVPRQFFLGDARASAAARARATARADVRALSPSGLADTKVVLRENSHERTTPSTWTLTRPM